MKWERRILMVAALALGIWFGIQNADLYGEVTLADFVLRMSGSTDKYYAMETSYMDLLQFVKLTIPSWVFIVYMGIAVYRHFCTSGIYIFVRCEKRLRWYRKEIGKLCMSAFVYQAVYMISVIAASMVVLCKSQFANFAHLQGVLYGGGSMLAQLHLLNCVAEISELFSAMLISVDGVYLFFMHLLIWSLWMITMTVFVNIVAFYFQSNGALLAAISLQVIGITWLGTQKSWVDAADEEIAAASRNLGWNPVTRLVLGWQSSRVSGIDHLLAPPYQGIYMEDSLAIYCGICGIAVCVLAAVVKYKDVTVYHDEQ